MAYSPARWLGTPRRTRVLNLMPGRVEAGFVRDVSGFVTPERSQRVRFLQYPAAGRARGHRELSLRTRSSNPVQWGVDHAWETAPLLLNNRGEII